MSICMLFVFHGVLKNVIVSYRAEKKNDFYFFSVRRRFESRLTLRAIKLASYFRGRGTGIVMFILKSVPSRATPSLVQEKVIRVMRYLYKYKFH